MIDKPFLLHTDDLKMPMLSFTFLTSASQQEQPAATQKATLKTLSQTVVLSKTSTRMVTRRQHLLLPMFRLLQIC